MTRGSSRESSNDGKMLVSPRTMLNKPEQWWKFPEQVHVRGMEQFSDKWCKGHDQGVVKGIVKWWKIPRKSPNNAEQARTMLNKPEQCRTMMKVLRIMMNNDGQWWTMMKVLRTMMNKPEQVYEREMEQFSDKWCKRSWPGGRQGNGQIMENPS